MKAAPDRAAVSLSGLQTGWLLVVVAATLAPLLPQLPLWLAGYVVLLYLWRLRIWREGGTLPRRLLFVAVTAFAVAGVLVAYRTLFGREAGVALLALFLALKLLEARTARDAMTVVFLAYFMQLAVFFETQSPLSAAYVAANLVVITAALTNLNRDGQTPGASLRLAGLMLAQAVPLMLVLFVLFPRVDGPLWGMPRDAYSGLSGLSDSMSPGSISQLSLSGAIAFRAKFDGAPPAPPALYWRGPVLSRFDGRSWHAARVTAGEGLPYAGAGRALDYTVVLEPHNKPWLFALELPGSLPEDAEATRDYQVVARRPVRTRMRYEMRSYPDLVAGAQEADDALRLARHLPAGANPRARELAARLRAGSADDAAVVRAALAHFTREPFVYTLSPPLLGEHSMDDFLFRTRRGFCEHYAAAFVFLMRSAGIPARVVTGYQGGEFNPVDGNLIVRQSDAHAWAEVWLAGRGWLRVDPTAAVAPSRIERGIGAALPEGDPLPFVIRADLDWLKAVRFRWEALSAAWDVWVLGYNALRQQEMLMRLGMRQPDWLSMSAALAVCGGLVLLALTAWSLRRQRQRDPVLRAWQRLSAKLAPAGLARAAHEGPLAYARRVAERRPALAAEMDEIARLYARLRYGRRAETPLREQFIRRVSELNIS